MTTPQRLPREFYQSSDVVALSQGLLGKVLVSRIDGQLTAGMIVETEAYRAPDDKACHAHLNRFTQRTQVMFAAGGTAYVYLCYGIHHLFNVVTGPTGMAHAVLVRAIEPLTNVELMLQRRGLAQLKPQLTAGPGVMTKALGITTAYNGLDLTTKDSPLWLEDRGIRISPDQIMASPRVGIDYAAECAQWPWRFRIADNRYTSKAK